MLGSARGRWCNPTGLLTRYADEILGNDRVPGVSQVMFEVVG